MFPFGFRTFLSCIFSNIAKKLFNPNLGGVGVSLNNSETVKAITLTFCNTQYLIIRDIRGKFGILFPISRYWANLRWVYFRFPDFRSIHYKQKLS